MDEVLDSTLGAEIDRLHAEHHNYAQRLEELLGKPYLSEDEEAQAAHQGFDSRSRTPIGGRGLEQVKGRGPGNNRQEIGERRAVGIFHVGCLFS